MVKHASRRADDDVGAFFEGIDLGAVADAAVHGRGAQPCVAENDLGFVPDLAGEFTGRHKDERLGAVPSGVKPLYHRQQKGAGLAGARARLDHHVAAGQQVRDGARLDGHQGRPAGAFDGSTQRTGQVVDGYIRQGVGRFFGRGVL